MKKYLADKKIIVIIMAITFVHISDKRSPFPASAV